MAHRAARRTRETAQGADDFPRLLRDICSKRSVPYSPAMTAKFRRFYREVVCRSEAPDPSITKIYMYAMVYRYTKTKYAKKTFLDGFRIRVFENALKVVRDWLATADDGPKNAIAGPYTTVCNLYSVREKRGDVA